MSFNNEAQILTEDTSEHISNQIDRLNQALETVMKEIEASSCSRNPSRLSIMNSELFPDDESSSSEEIEVIYDRTIERLLQTIDRQQMIIEDLFSEEKRRSCHHEPRERTCNHDLNRIRKEVWLQVKMQKNEQNERERQKFEEKLEMLDSLQSDYLSKHAELAAGIETLKLKEKLLKDKETLLINKEKEIRDQRLMMDRMKSEHDSEKLPFKDSPIEEESKSPNTKHDQLKNLQTEIQTLESYKATCKSEDFCEIDLKIESLRCKVARLRGEIAISESSKATRLMSSMMVSIQKEVNRDERAKRMDLVHAANKHLYQEKSKQVLTKDSNEAKPAIKVGECGAPVPKGFSEPEKAKEMNLKDFCSQPGVIRIPEAKDLIEKVNLTLSKLNTERMLFDKEREDFDKEKLEWIRNREKRKMKN